MHEQKQESEIPLVSSLPSIETMCREFPKREDPINEHLLYVFGRCHTNTHV